MTDLEEVRDVAVTDSGTVLVATDNGVLVYAGDAAPERIGVAEGLPSSDVHAIANEADGSVLIATANGLATLRDGQAARLEGVPAHARVTDLAITSDGNAWLCTLSGLLRRTGGAWEQVGEPLHCTTLSLTPEGHLWVGTDRGILSIEGDTVHEHGVSSGIPEPFVRSIVPVLPGQILALVEGAQRAQLAFWNGTNWYGYTLPGLEESVIGLVAGESRGATLITTERAFFVAPTGSGTAFRALSSREGNVRHFPGTGTVAASESTQVDASRVLRPPQPMAAVPESGPSVDAPSLVAIPLQIDGLPSRMYRAFVSGAQLFVAAANQGVLGIGPRDELRRFRSHSLVPDADLQVATETRGGVWMRARGGAIAKWQDGRWRRLELPEGLRPQAVASGPRGAYLAAFDEGTSHVRIFVSESGAFRLFLERDLEAPISAIPFMGVSDDGRIWLAVNVSESRSRGMAMIDPDSDTVAYYHRAVTEGQGLAIPDEVSAISFDAAGNPWFATLNGAVRLEEHQAIVFDETRGVRGEVVTDVASGSARMWIAAAEGLGSYSERAFDFHQPLLVRERRPAALATDSAGHLWAAGMRGLLEYDGTEWHDLSATGALPIEQFLDVEVDGAGRVWLLGEDTLVVLLGTGSPQ
jgi:ligand-binding sensor domain-containing protein